MIDLNQTEWREKIANDENAVQLDVRTQFEVEEGYIPNAQVLDVQNPGVFMDGVNALDKSKNYYVYCRSGGRSVQACMILESLGFQKTFNLLGGFSEWDGEKAV
jgi:rhodanese-related sulfurtransferase